jgi:hypothetical protein
MVSLACDHFAMGIPNWLDDVYGHGGPEEVSMGSLCQGWSPARTVSGGSRCTQLRMHATLLINTYVQDNLPSRREGVSALTDTHAHGGERTAYSTRDWRYFMRLYSGWRVVDLVLIVTYAVGAYYRITAAYSGQQYIHLTLSRFFYAIAVIALYVRISRFCMHLEGLGPKLFMLKLMMGDVVSFLALWALALLAYVGAISAITFGPPSHNVQQAFIIPLFQVCGPPPPLPPHVCNLVTISVSRPPFCFVATLCVAHHVANAVALCADLWRVVPLRARGRDDVHKGLSLRRLRAAAKHCLGSHVCVSFVVVVVVVVVVCCHCCCCCCCCC